MENKPIPTDPAEFDKYLTRYDWFYYMSDDHRVYMGGLENEKRLNNFLFGASDELKRIYQKHHAKHFNTELFVSADRPYKKPYPSLS